MSSHFNSLSKNCFFNAADVLDFVAYHRAYVSAATQLVFTISPKHFPAAMSATADLHVPWK